MGKEIKSRECRFVFHAPYAYGMPDTHIIKELLHYTDGCVDKKLRIVTDFKRPFWVTKMHKRTHKDKKESESLDNVLEGKCTENDLARAVSVKLGSRYNGKPNLRNVKGSSYTYGLDINSRTYIKHLYQEQYPDMSTPYDVCVLDIEVDTLTNEIIIISIATREQIYTVVTKKFLQQKITTKNRVTDIEKQVTPKLEYLYKKNIPTTDINKSISVKYAVAEDELDLIKLSMSMLHKWKPDLVVVWNIEYDLNKIVDVLNKNHVPPKDILCDPDLPDNLKYFKYRQGQKQKKTSSGAYRPLNPEEQWHWVDCPASFYWIDAMSAHRFIRAGGKSIPGGYSLDNILKHELGEELGKLKFKDNKTTNIKGIDWHKHMVANKPLEYVIYNQWDVMSILELDNKTKDLSMVLPMLSGISNFDIFNSGPRRIVDAMHFFYLEQNRVLACRNPIVNQDSLLGLKKWITLLPSCRLAGKNISVLSGDGNNPSNIRGFVYDSDQVSGYPKDTQAANVSKDTTVKEVRSIGNIPLDVFREANINLLMGQVNSIRYGNTMLNLPSIFEIIEYVNNK